MRKKVETLGKMKILENKSGFPVSDVICISKRDGNKKRPYLILNKLQAKYIPVHPSDTIEMFANLGSQIDLGEEDPANPLNIIVVGFAETATAIGAEVASVVQDRYPSYNVTFLPTTREVYDVGPDGKELDKVEFTEDHSHAVEQILYANKELLKSAHYTIFAEDEVTTGNTIRHCVEKLKTMTDARYIVASLMNCMDKDEMQKFKELGISAYWLIKTDKGGFDDYVTEYDVSDEIEMSEAYDSARFDIKETDVVYNKLDYTSDNILSNVEGEEVLPKYCIINNPRLGVKIRSYRTRCNKIAYNISSSDSVINRIKELGKKITDTKILCIGTEECMYPAIVLAKAFEKIGADSYVQATTRVPTCVHVAGEETLKNRYTIDSMYGDRVNYIYNMDRYDSVFVVTDGKKSPNKLMDVLKFFKNKDISVVYV